MRNKYIITAAMSISGLIILSCSSPKKITELKPGHCYGKWTCRIMDGEFSGIDTLYFNSNLKFNDSQSLSYKSSDSGFDFFTRFYFNIGGTWKLKSDSIYICYESDSFTFNLDASSFRVNATAQGADTTNMQELRNDMLKDLSEYLSKTVKARYENISNRDVYLGRVTYLDRDSMIISNNGNSLTLLRATICK